MMITFWKITLQIEEIPKEKQTKKLFKDQLQLQQVAAGVCNESFLVSEKAKWKPGRKLDSENRKLQN